MENVGQFAVTVSRDGDLSHTVVVDFKTEDGTANAGGDYEGVEETLTFRPGETHKQVRTFSVSSYSFLFFLLSLSFFFLQMQHSHRFWLVGDK